MQPAALAAAGVPAYWRVEIDGADGPIVYCHRLNGGVYSDIMTLTPGNQEPVLVAGTISVTFDPADLHKPRR